MGTRKRPRYDAVAMATAEARFVVLLAASIEAARARDMVPLAIDIDIDIDTASIRNDFCADTS